MSSVSGIGSDRLRIAHFCKGLWSVNDWVVCWLSINLIVSLRWAKIPAKSHQTTRKWSCHPIKMSRHQLKKNWKKSKSFWITHKIHTLLVKRFAVQLLWTVRREHKFVVSNKCDLWFRTIEVIPKCKKELKMKKRSEMLEFGSKSKITHKEQE